jgi:2-amino-4-hydroxy-6-hydroxymethyldihydropteridine diphosphokinase
MASCLIALGSNLGDSTDLINHACRTMEQLAGLQLTATSTIIKTAAVGGPANQPPFHNSALLVETTLSPRQLLSEIRSLEQQLGRQQDVRWGPRTIDLDLLLYDNLVIQTADLQLPHPRMTFRHFVLEPACEVAASFRHPVNGATLEQLRRHLRVSVNYMAIVGPGSDLLAERVADRDACLLARGRPGVDDDFPGTLQQALHQDPSGWVVSDGWVDQLLLGRAPAIARWHQQRHLVPQPKVLVAIEPTGEDERRAWCRITNRPHGLPVLALPAGNLDGQIEEVRAALTAARVFTEPGQ